MIRVGHILRRFNHPAAGTPNWHERVERWYQLDAFAFGLAELASDLAARPAPALILLASPGASNASDARFVETGLASPSKFVHTLPNVRGSSFCQVLGWAGPSLCVQKDPHTIAAALREGETLVGKRFRRVWVLGTRALGGERYESFALTLGDECGTFELEIAEPNGDLRRDEELFLFLDTVAKEKIL